MNFNNLVEKLNKSMIKNYVAVNNETNPISANKKTLDETKLGYVIAQYTLFPKSIVSFLLIARNLMRKHNWIKADIELTRNAGEELGTETLGETHYNILVDGIKETLSINLKNEVPKNSTELFISKMLKIMKTDNSSYVAGATYALESSAVPELSIVLQITRTLAKDCTGSDNLSPKLEKFFDDHINNWEEGHETGLRETYSEYIKTNAQAGDFETGFRDVMNAMDVWWNGIHEECEKLKNAVGD